MQDIHELVEVLGPRLNGRVPSPRVEYPIQEVIADEMTVAEMYEETNRIRTRNQFLATVPEFMAAQKPGSPNIVDHLIYFIGEVDVKFIADDGVKALAALQSWYAENKDRDVMELKDNGTELKMVRYIPKLKLSDNEIPFLSLRRDIWNDYLYVLLKQKVGLTGNSQTRIKNGT